MAYTELIKRKVTEYFKDRYNLSDYKRGWLKGNCPECGKFKFGIRVADERVNCFSCGPKPKPLNYIMELEGFKTLREVLSLLKAFEGTDYLQIDTVDDKREVKNVLLPETFKLMILGNSLLSKSARNYMRKRGFNNITLSSLGIGYCTKGEYAGIIIFPFYQQNKLIYFIGRRFIQLFGEKFKNPSVDDFGIGKSMITYNVDALQVYTKIYLVEAVINAITIGMNSVAILGKKISNYQKSMLIRSPAKEFIFCLDPDAITDTLSLAMELVNFKKVKIIHFPEKKDVNDMGKKWVKTQEKISQWLTYKDLIKLKNEAISSNSYNS